MKYKNEFQPVNDSGQPLPALLSILQAAELAGVSGRTITRLCDNGTIKAVKVGNLWRINRDALLVFLGLE